MNKLQAARYIARKYADKSADRMEIDTHAECSPIPQGIWVQAWVLVSNKEIDDLLKDDSTPPVELR